MKTVLFAIDGMSPDRRALDYTLTLCRRMLAKLDVLHIVRSPARPARYLKTLASGALRARDAFENTMVAATFAQAGVTDPEEALKSAAYDQFKRKLPQKTDAPINYHCVVTGDPTDKVIERYVHGHRNVVLAIFDSQPAKKEKKSHTSGRKILPILTIPLVRVTKA
jgi:hypothetical protein